MFCFCTSYGSLHMLTHPYSAPSAGTAAASTPLASSRGFGRGRSVVAAGSTDGLVACQRTMRCDFESDHTLAARRSRFGRGCWIEGCFLALPSIGRHCLYHLHPEVTSRTAPAAPADPDWNSLMELTLRICRSSRHRCCPLGR